MSQNYSDAFWPSDECGFGDPSSDEASEGESNEPYRVQSDEQSNQLPNQQFGPPPDQSIDQPIVKQPIQRIDEERVSAFYQIFVQDQVQDFREEQEDILGQLSGEEQEDILGQLSGEEQDDALLQENEQPFDARQDEAFNEQGNELEAGEDQNNDQNPPPRKRKAKTKVHLSGSALEFKEHFKLLLEKTGADPRKVKEMVKECHKAVHEHLDLPKLNRDQQRSIDLYFRDFWQSEDVLLPSFETYLLNYRNNTYGNQS